MERKPQDLCRFIGKAGEHQVACQLLLQGLSTAWPDVDEGYDLVAANNCRIQVKTGRMRQTQSTIKAYGGPVYTLHFPKGKRIMSGSAGNYTISIRPPIEKSCDVLVFWGIEENRFWIIPSRLLANQQMVKFGPNNKRNYASELTEMREMVSLGFSQQEIAQYYGIHQSSVWARLSKDDEKFTGKATYAIRACEGAWNHILDFGQPIVSEALVSETSDVLNSIEEA